MEVKRKRSENWCPQDKKLLRKIIANSAHIVENKCNKTSSIMKKSQEWIKITKQFNEITGKNRREDDIKMAWKRMKLMAKANLTAYKQQMMNGNYPRPKSPTQADLAVMAIACNEVTVDILKEDSDSAQNEINDKSDSSEPGPSLVQMESLIDESRTSEPQNATEPDILPEDPLFETRKKPSKVTQNIHQMLSEKIVESNINFKNRQLQMLEEEHEHNIQVAKLKIRKLLLEIDILETNRNNINC